MRTRRLVLIDVENFNGGPVQTTTQARWCRRMIDNWIKPVDGDIVVVAADVAAVTNVYAGWPSHRILSGYGHNGADLRLLEVMDENLAARFSEMVLVSGDRIFAEKVSWLAGQGLPTTVFSHQAGLAKRLAFAATKVVTTAVSPAIEAVTSDVSPFPPSQLSPFPERLSK